MVTTCQYPTSPNLGWIPNQEQYFDEQYFDEDPEPIDANLSPNKNEDPGPQHIEMQRKQTQLMGNERYVILVDNLTRNDG